METKNISQVAVNLASKPGAKRLRYKATCHIQSNANPNAVNRIFSTRDNPQKTPLNAIFEAINLAMKDPCIQYDAVHYFNILENSVIIDTHSARKVKTDPRDGGIRDAVFIRTTVKIG